LILRNAGLKIPHCSILYAFAKSPLDKFRLSIWVKSIFPEMRDRFFRKIRQAVSCECEFIVLEQAPAMGAILGAYKNLNHCIPPENFKEKVAKNTSIFNC